MFEIVTSSLWHPEFYTSFGPYPDLCFTKAPPSVNGRSKYTVRSAYREDAGRYTCIAENPAGLEQTSNTVLVKGENIWHEV